MSIDDRGLSGEQYAELTCGTENVSPYSSSAGYTEPPSYYQTEYNWHHPQQQNTPQQTQLHEPGRHYYQGLADGNDTSTHGYITYSHHPTSHADFYSPGHNLWPTDNSGGHLASEHISPHHRFFSGVDRSQQCLIQQANTPSGSNGKPKRRRVQSHSQRKAANVRERRRMFHLNEAFDELRKRLPAFNYEKRLSRIETLRLAMTYISFMKEVSIGRDPKCVKLKPHGADLSPLPRCGSSMVTSPSFYSDKDNNDDSDVNEDSECSNDEISNISEAN